LSRIRLQDFITSLTNLYSRNQILIHVGDLLGSRLGLSRVATKLVGVGSGRVSHILQLVTGIDEQGPYSMVIQSNGNLIDWEAMAKRAVDLRKDVALVLDRDSVQNSAVVRSTLESDAPDTMYDALKHVPAGLACIYGPGEVDMRKMYGSAVRPVGSELFVGRYVVERPYVEAGKDVQFNDTILLDGGVGIDVPADGVGKASRRLGTMVVRPGGKKYWRFRDGPVMDAFEVWRVNAVALEDES
jgi:hypothetical protein